MYVHELAQALPKLTKATGEAIDGSIYKSPRLATKRTKAAYKRPGTNKNFVKSNNYTYICSQIATQ